MVSVHYHDNFMEPLEFKNYKAFCNYFEIPVKTGEAKQNQLEYLNTVLTMHRVENSHRIIVTDIHGNVNGTTFAHMISEEKFNQVHAKEIQEIIDNYIIWYSKRNKEYDLDDLRKKAEQRVFSKYKETIKKRKTKHVRVRKWQKRGNRTTYSFDEGKQKNKDTKNKLITNLKTLDYSVFRKNATYVPYVCSILNNLLDGLHHYEVTPFNLYGILGFHRQEGYSYVNINNLIKEFNRKIQNHNISLLLLNHYHSLFSLKKRNVLNSSIKSLKAKDTYSFFKTYLLLNSEYKPYYLSNIKDIHFVNKAKQKTTLEVIGHNANYLDKSHFDKCKPFLLNKINSHFGENYTDIFDAYRIIKGKNHYEFCDITSARKIINKNI